jgi:para-aminobenzoate synthetase component 1
MQASSGFFHVRPVAIQDATALPRALASLDHPFALVSNGRDGRSRWSFFGAEPFAVFRGDDYEGARALWRELGARARAADDFGAADAAAPDAGDAPVPPFRGGALGYWAYDFGRRLERLPMVARDDLGLPDFVLAFYDVVVAFDHATGRAWAWSSGFPELGRERHERAERRLEEMTRRLQSIAPDSSDAAPDPALAPRVAPAVEARSTFKPDDYLRAVESVREHIRRGDIFQANLSQRWTVPLARQAPQQRAARLFERLAREATPPFAAWFGAGDHALASASPERFLELRDGIVETRPIKGTRPRGADAAEDARLAAELLASAKDRAENVMIVDVLRNDLGRVCRIGSVETVALCELETFPHVFHLTSTVTGRLLERRDAFDLIAACFPGGSITGAPKIRAMEILERLEPTRRHCFTGSLGYLDWSGNADWNIVIRSALVQEEAVHFAAGGGITADSDPEAEYLETLHKGEAVRAALASIAGDVTLDSRRVVA